MYLKADPFERVFGRDLSSYIKSRVLAEVGKMKQDLDINGLHVILVPAPEPRYSGHRIRVVHCRNPKWYREIYGELEVKRDRIISSLNRILNETPSNKSSYDYMFLQIAKDRLLEGYEDESVWIPHDNYVRVFLGFDPQEIPIEQEPELENSNIIF